MAIPQPRSLILALLLALCATAFAHTARADGPVVTGYLPTGNDTYSGHSATYADAWENSDNPVASCSRAYPIGTQIQLWDGVVITCWDRGALDEYGVTFDILVASRSDANYVGARYSGTVFLVIRWGLDCTDAC